MNTHTRLCSLDTKPEDEAEWQQEEKRRDSRSTCCVSVTCEVGEVREAVGLSEGQEKRQSVSLGGFLVLH